MNYTLKIQLEGADEVNAQLDKLLAGVGNLAQGKMPKMSFEEWLNYGDAEDVGENVGKEISKGATKYLKSFNILDAWGKSVNKGFSDWWNDAVKKGISERNSIKGLREVTGTDLSKVQSLPDINDLTKSLKVDFKKIALGVLTFFTGNEYVAARVISDEFGKLTAGKTGGIVGGLFGKGGIMAFAEILAGFKIFKLAVNFFKAGSDIFMQAVNRADKFYSNALQNGMGLGFSIRRQTLAQIIGVSEQDVFRFGAQMNYLNPRLDQAVKILSETTTPLTQVSYEFKILKTDLSATWATLANQVTPAVLEFVGTLDELVKMFNTVADSKLFKIAFSAYALSIGSTSIFGSFFREGILKQLNNPMPNPQAWMKQLPASHWEKMGLVVMGGTTNYQKQIAQNTKSIAQDIKKLVTKKTASLSESYNSAFNWNMSPNTNNP